MASAGQPAATAPATMEEKKPTSSIPKGKTELKILMLHGYTQSGPLFSAKTKALNKLLIKALSPAPLNLHPTLIFPSGPHRLRPSDIPGYVPSEDPSQRRDDDDLDNWAWFRKDDATGSYAGLDDGMHRVATAIREADGVDGVLGFSQGGCMASLVASALEQPHRAPVAESQPWLPELRAANGGRPLKFCVVYSGFHATPSDLQWLFEPALATPTLHFLGGLDTVVEEKRSMALVERCRDPMVLTHPGGHYVPVARDWVMQLAGWLRQRCVEAADEGTKESL
ncbi:serine hydrolase FSH [Xylaria bambusicola]|uniref:serine hydrolase FSH n=1 Tax=Xylaria bambusicola TaxID=326684 RepID=UPI002007DB14|nr:serine hydrolase FSH [Xylaria bambusicola]KAI0521068.1 serine hydrolase FSH [Xylaria bambusicola]